MMSEKKDAEAEFPYASRFPREVCDWLDQMLPPSGVSYIDRNLQTIVSAITSALTGDEPSCMSRLKARLL